MVKKCYYDFNEVFFKLSVALRILLREKIRSVVTFIMSTSGLKFHIDHETRNELYILL